MMSRDEIAGAGYLSSDADKMADRLLQSIAFKMHSSDDDLIREAAAMLKRTGQPRPCTCHPDDRPEGECRQLYAASDCAARLAPAPEREGVQAWLYERPNDTYPTLPPHKTVTTVRLSNPGWTETPLCACPERGLSGEHPTQDAIVRLKRLGDLHLPEISDRLMKEGKYIDAANVMAASEAMNTLLTALAQPEAARVGGGDTARPTKADQLMVDLDQRVSRTNGEDALLHRRSRNTIAALAARVGDTPQSASGDGGWADALADVLENLLSSEPDMPTAQDDYDEADRVLTEYRALTTAPASSVEDGWLREAASELLQHIGLSYESHTSDLLWRSPAEQMRKHAEDTERRDAAILTLRAALQLAAASEEEKS